MEIGEARGGGGGEGGGGEGGGGGGGGEGGGGEKHVKFTQPLTHELSLCRILQKY